MSCFSCLTHFFSFFNFGFCGLQGKEMTVVDKRGALMDEIGGVNNQFPIGMRVLAVDDNPTCLKLLETSLRKCQYHVTITNQAVKALQLLRENKNNYDLVISDVNMPDIDGFKLLELIGLEMDLPVIMLSEYSDTKLVMKGITHGARDYLLKPVRYEELKNIWQHVIRGKRVESKDQNKSVDQGKAVPGTGEAGQVATSRNTDQDAKLNRKRKDQNEDEEEDFEDNENEREDLGTQKKPRVVWSVELHGKFVSAVNQLGLDKAVPKKILDLMNVEGLTRENVASHLQKYRLYLKRLNNVAIQQANMVAAFGNKDSSYLRMGSLDGLNDFRSLAGPGRYSSTSLSSYLPGGMLARLNAPATLTLRGITSSGMVQPGPSQNFSNSFDSLSKFPSGGSPANNGTNLIQGFPTLNQFQQSKAIDPTKDLNLMGNSNAFTAITSFPEVGVGLGNSNNTMNIAASSNSLLLQGNPQQTQIRTLLNNQSSPGMASSNPDLFDIGVGGFSNPLHPLNEQLPLTNFRETASSSNPQVQSTPIDFSSSVAHSQDVGCPRDLDSQAGLIGNLVQNRSYTPDQRQDCSQNLIHNYSSINGNIVKSNANYMLDQTKSQDGYLQNSYDSLDDVMSAMVKRTDAMLMDGELEFDAYSSLGSCM